MSISRVLSISAFVLSAFVSSGCESLLGRAPGGEALLDAICPAPAASAPTPAPEPARAPAPTPPPAAAPAPSPAPAIPARIVLRGVRFDFDRAEISAVSRVVLDAAADALARYPSLRVEISGHTDSSGAAEYNQMLSERRARSVADYLISKGIAASRLRIVGYGETRPVADNSTRDGRAQNRRTELKVLR